MAYTGRTVIYTSVEEIDSTNVLDVIDTALDTHEQNASDIQYLYDYYKGQQPILDRVKEVRSDINNTIVENRAKEIVDFKTGYLIGEPIQYIGRGTDTPSDKIKLLNDMMLSDNKAAKDSELVEWQMICGTAYKMAFGDVETSEDDIAPFETYVVDPRQAFVIYSSDIKKRPLAGVFFNTDSENNTHYHVYTDSLVFTLLNTDTIESTEANTLGVIPLIEFPANSARLGAFEPVLTMLDALNTIDSNRVDGIEQFIQSLIVFINCGLKEGTTSSDIVKSGIVELTSHGDMQQNVKILSEELNQTQTQTLKDDIYQSILTICAMPNRSANFGSDTGVAVVYRDGWSAAETSAKKSELAFKQSERTFLKLILNICDGRGLLDLKESDIEIKFTRRNYENLESKSQVLNTLLDNNKVAPRLAFMVSNLFPDSEEAYLESMEWYEAHKDEITQAIQSVNQTSQEA